MARGPAKKTRCQRKICPSDRVGKKQKVMGLLFLFFVAATSGGHGRDFLKLRWNPVVFLKLCWIFLTGKWTKPPKSGRNGRFSSQVTLEFTKKTRCQRKICPSDRVGKKQKVMGLLFLFLSRPP